MKVYLNKIIKDERIPFIIEISPSLKVYYRKEKNIQLFRANSFLGNKKQWLYIYIDKFKIVVKGEDDNRKFVYTIEEIKEGENINVPG